MDVNSYIESFVREIWSETHGSILKRILLRLIGVRQVKTIFVIKEESSPDDFEEWLKIRKELSHWRFDGNELKAIESIPEEALDKKHHFSTTPTVAYFVSADQTEIGVGVAYGYCQNGQGHRAKWSVADSQWHRTYTWVS